MSFLHGRKPNLLFVQHAMVLAVLWSPIAEAAAEPLSLAAAERLALADEPGQQVLQARADALLERSVAVGQLPDPKLRLGLANFPLESGGFSTEGMTHLQVGVRQSFPPGKTRSISTRQAQTGAARLNESAAGRARAVRSAAREHWLEAWYWTQAGNVVAQMRPLFADLADITTSLYSVGRRDQQDVLRAQLELSRLDDRIIAIERGQAEARARLAQWIGGDSQRPLAPELPAWPAPPALDYLHDRLTTHPIVAAANAEIMSRAAAIELAEQARKPGWALDVGYAYRDGRLSNGVSRPDFVSVAVTMDLPVFRKNRQDRQVAAAVSERRAARATRDELLRELASQLRQHHARWHDTQRRLALYERTIVPTTQEHTQAALSAYQSETADFADVMRAAVDELNTRLDYLRLQTDRAQAWAALANLGGLQP